jgi:sugar (pentulose or hexulose) kinase
MPYLSIDLGTTNIKAAFYDDSLAKIGQTARTVRYIRDGKQVEFDADAYFEDVLSLVKSAAAEHGVDTAGIKRLVLTGQAESLVMLNGAGHPLANAISWMDERSEEECMEIAGQLAPDECYAITGQTGVVPTWPATKILWLKKHRPEVYGAVKTYVLLKDYIAYRLTGKLRAECSIATFSFYFNIFTQHYWDKMLSIIGVSPSQLPEFIEPGTDLGPLGTDAVAKTGLSSAVVNVGVLDHFAGMIGTGNIVPGTISESTGTVLAIAAMAKLPLAKDERTAVHYGPFPKTHTFLAVAESGGICLEWYRDRFLPGVSFRAIDEEINKRGERSELLFLPYITGVNGPEMDMDTCGIFFGLKSRHDAYDLAAAVMEGVALLLDRNIRGLSGRYERIISTGGAAKSELWLKMKANATGLAVDVPADEEAALLGAAISGATASGSFRDFEEACKAVVKMKKRILPNPEGVRYFDKKRAVYDKLYENMPQMARMLQ